MVKNSQENDSEKVKVIIGKLIENAELTVRPVISSFDSSQSRSVNIKRLDQFNVVILEKCADFLGIPLADKDNFKLFTKPTLIGRLYLGFKALLPAKCGECSEEYVIDREPNVAPFFSCFRCFQGSHDCDRNRTLHQALSTMNPLTGFVWLCNECHGIIDPIEPRKQKSRHVSASESLLDNQSIDSSGDFSASAHRNAMSSTQNLNQQVSFPKISHEQKSEESISSESNSGVLCQNFLKWKCPHGISGKKKIHGNICPYVHPRVCNQYRLSGSSSKNGCQKGGNCSFFHPEICHIDEQRELGHLFPFIAITESWLKSYHSDAQLQVPGYSLTRSDRSKRTGGGVMLYSLSSLSVSISETFDDSVCQGIISIFPSAKLCVAVAYRPPDASAASFSKMMDCFARVIEDCKPSDYDLFVSGDFNLPQINWDTYQIRSGGTSESNTAAKCLLNFMSTHLLSRGGAHPKKTKKNQSLHQNWQIGIGFFWFFLVFFGFLKFPNWHWFFLVFFGFFWFFWHWFWPEFEIGNWFFLVFFGFFWFFLVFFGLSFSQHSKLETGFWFFLVFFGFFWFFLGFFGFFWHLILWLECHPKKNQKKPKNTKKNQKKPKKPKKNQKKPVATPKLVNWLGFFWFFLVFFGFFWGEHPP